MNEETLGIIAVIIFVIISLTVGFILYFLPTIIAKKRGHQNTVAIFVINFFLGFTLLGWLGALLWAVMGEKKALPSMLDERGYMSTKKVVAREGLIILSIILAFVVVVLLFNKLPYERPQYRYVASLYGNKLELFSNSRFYNIFLPTEERNDIIRKLIKRNPLNYGKDDVQSFEEYGWVPSGFKIEFDKKVSSPKDNTYEILLYLMLFIMLAYPIYLIFRFIIWATRTLREKE